MKTHLPIRNCKTNEIAAYVVRDWETVPRNDKITNLLLGQLGDITAKSGFPIGPPDSYGDVTHKACPSISVTEVETNVIIGGIPYYLLVLTGDSLSLEPISFE